MDNLFHMFMFYLNDQEPDAISYNIQVSRSNQFINLLIDLDTPDLVYIHKDQKYKLNNTYYWRVRPIYDGNTYGDWIDNFTFTVRNRNNTGDIQISMLNEDSYNDGLTIMGDLSDDNRSVVFDKDGRQIWNDHNKKLYYELCK